MSLISSKEKAETTMLSYGKCSEVNDISPSYVDTSNPKYISIDNYFVSSLLITNYNNEMTETFLDKCISLDLNLQVSMFYEKKNSYEIIKELTCSIGNIGANIKTTNENQSDIDIMGSSYADAKYIRKELQLGGEDFYYLYAYITLYANSKEELEFEMQKLEGVLAGCGLASRRAIFREEQTFFSTIPIMQNNEDVKSLVARNVLTSGLVATYPFLSNELCDEDGIIIGTSELDNSLVMIDRFETSKYKNANMYVLGTSGSGKSYFVKLMIARNRYLDINQYIIDPDREYIKLCEKLGGTLIKFGSNTSINVMDIREACDGEEHGYLRNKIDKLNIFFGLLIPDLTNDEKALLEEKIIQCYNDKGITFDDKSLFLSNEAGKLLGKRKFKGSTDMPILSDLFILLNKNKKTKRIASLLKPALNGSLKFLNSYTNVDLKNKLVVSDIHDIEEKVLAPVMFVITDFYWDKIRQERSQKKILYFDEAWRLIGSNEETANFIFKIFKTIRKYRWCSYRYNAGRE